MDLADTQRKWQTVSEHPLEKILVPFFAPIGLGFWQIAVALIAGISAKEVVVSSCAVFIWNS